MREPWGSIPSLKKKRERKEKQTPKLSSRKQTQSSNPPPPKSTVFLSSPNHPLKELFLPQFGEPVSYRESTRPPAGRDPPSHPSAVVRTEEILSTHWPVSRVLLLSSLDPGVRNAAYSLKTGSLSVNSKKRTVIECISRYLC